MVDNSTIIVVTLKLSILSKSVNSKRETNTTRISQTKSHPGPPVTLMTRVSFPMMKITWMTRIVRKNFLTRNLTYIENLNNEKLLKRLYKAAQAEIDANKDGEEG